MYFDSCKGHVKKPTSGQGDYKEITKAATPTLDIYGQDLTERAEKGMIQQIKGRDNEINLVRDTLCRVFKYNPLFVDSARVGKTAVLEGLAHCIASREITNALKGKRIVELNMGSLLAGIKYWVCLRNTRCSLLKKHPIQISFFL